MTSDPGPYAGHVCLAFDSRAALESRARHFLDAGRAAGELAFFVAAAAPARPLPFAALGETYPDGAIVDPTAQVEAYAAATDEALAAGYTGLRVVADATPLVRTPAQLEAFARYEFLIGRYLADHPFRAVCAYDRGEPGDDVIAQLACMHAESEAAVPFRLHACPSAEGCAALAGELDWSVDELFSATLRRADLAAAGDEVVLRADHLRFADHGSLLRLQQYAAEHETTVVPHPVRMMPGGAAGTKLGRMAFRRTAIVLAVLVSAVSLTGCGEAEAPASPATAAASSAPPAASVAWADGVCTASTGLRESVRQLSASVPTDLSSSSTTVDQVRAEVGTRMDAVRQSAAAMRTAVTALPPGADPVLVAAQQQLQTASQRVQQSVDQLGAAATQVTASQTTAQTVKALVSLTGALAGTTADVGAYLNALRGSVNSRTDAVRAAFGAAPACAGVGSG